MKKKSFSQKILFNNQIMLILSVVISLAIWVYMSTGTSNDTVVTVNDVPIQVALPDEATNAGLQTFFEDSGTAYASVTVSGNRKLLGSISKDDFIVTANASSVDHADTYNLPVSADKKSTINNTFQITNCNPPKITVKIDTESKKDFKLLPKFKYSAKDDYYASVTYDNDTVTITGPSEEVRAISKVCAVTEDMENLENSKDFHAAIVLYDANDKELSKDYLTMSATSVDGTVNVSPKKTVEVKATFANKPQDFDITEDIMTIDPKQVSIAGERQYLDKVFSVSLDEIDFSTLRNQKYNFDTLKPIIPDGCKLIDTNSVFKVSMDLSKLKSKKFTVSNFTVKNLSEGYKSEITSKNLVVEFIGSSDDLKSLKEDKITGIVDASEIKGNTGSQELPVKFELEDNKTCWAYGSYLVNVKISK
ncbi:MAG: CdaR family protein [Ruminococcus sp.]|nr:CdaR family protein [Ruminococcus sp.]